MERVYSVRPPVPGGDAWWHLICARQVKGLSPTPANPEYVADLVQISAHCPRAKKIIYAIARALNKHGKLVLP